MKTLALDYGAKRCGLAISDDSGIFAYPLKAVSTDQLMPELLMLATKEKIKTLVVGQPKYMDGNAMPVENAIQEFLKNFTEKLPAIAVKRMDERFTSGMASQSLAEAGYKKKDRNKKENIDVVSAVIILQSYLQQNP